MDTIGIAGAGLLGRLLAWRLSRAGHAVEVFDPGDAAPTFDGRGAAAFTAAGMLSPVAELDNAGPEVARLGLRSIGLWREIVAALPGAPFFSERGSLLLAHRADLGAAQRVLARLRTDAVEGLATPQPLDDAQLRDLEPALFGIAHAWLLGGEAQIDTPAVMAALHQGARGVHWHWGEPVVALTPGVLHLARGRARHFDLVFDVRGVGARPLRDADRGPTPPLRGEDLGFTTQLRGEDLGFTPQIRGVRGETVWLHAPGLGLTRPLRLLHPRHRVYIVPRPGDVVIVGASEVESEDRSPVSLKSAVELMAAAHSVLPALAEARILRLDRNLRPALPDHEPHTEVRPGLVRINGLFRHGWLLAPALVDDALAALARCEGVAA